MWKSNIEEGGWPLGIQALHLPLVATQSRKGAKGGKGGGDAGKCGAATTSTHATPTPTSPTFTPIPKEQSKDEHVHGCQRCGSDISSNMTVRLCMPHHTGTVTFWLS